MRMSHFLATAVAVCAFASGATLMAQVRNPNQNPNLPGALPAQPGVVAPGGNNNNNNNLNTSANADNPAGANRESMTDRMVADHLLGMSIGEIELARFAEQHAQSPEVKKFAQQMVEQHTQFNNELSRFASQGVWNQQTGAAEKTGDANTRDDANRIQANADRDNRNNAGQPGNVTIGERPNANETAGREHGDIVRQHQMMAKQITSAIEKELGQFQGNEFDRAYVGQQFWDHVVFIAAAKAADNNVSDNQLKQVVQQGTQTAEHHLDATRKLIRDLSSNVASRPTTTEEPRR